MKAKVHNPPQISSPIGSSPDQNVVARQLARRFRVSLAHAGVIASLAGICGLHVEGRR